MTIVSVGGVEGGGVSSTDTCHTHTVSSAGSQCQRTEVSTHVVGRAQVPEQARSCGQGERMRAA
eukprot:COSAG01_NODE_64094_length_277_cov_3.707865_1_plen_63_part_01